jgi:uncharacterized protein YndB with AHSA1/START domain
MTTPIELRTWIAARPATVLAQITEPAGFAAWFGPGATIDPVAGGAFRVSYPGGQAAAGQVVELGPGRVVLSWGLEGDLDLPPGSSRVELTMAPADGGTLVELRHSGLPAGLAEGQAAGFTHHLAVLAAVCAQAEVGPLAERLADQVTAAFNCDDGDKRLEVLAACWAEAGSFADPRANLAGLGAMNAHIANARRFAPGATLVRAGAVSVSHRLLLWPWRIEGADGGVWAAGTNVAAVDPDGRIAAMTGFWAAAPAG